VLQEDIVKLLSWKPYLYFYFQKYNIRPKMQQISTKMEEFLSSANVVITLGLD